MGQSGCICVVVCAFLGVVVVWGCGVVMGVGFWCLEISSCRDCLRVGTLMDKASDL